MSHINFLEKRGWNWKEAEFNYLFIVLATAVALFFLIAYGLVQKIRLDHYQNKLAAAISQVEVLKGLRKPPASGEDASKTFAMSANRRVHWAPLLNALSEKTSQAIWIQTLQGSTESKKLEIEGASLHWPALSRFKKDLESVVSFERVSILSSQALSDGKISFKMEVLLQ